ncbi:hypothetical protein [Streptomyces sp. ISL-86]|uniref:hypothetical protein n=1 Tax=Streptomyces sp. ISL-86 TaxID=2819187 RepID=UPI001BE8301B|nr:hypothetical protein [Streptomyces sp. ISL-86]MBT2453671.1 hypothetical protein [Streptomyces sp. ISL-86]
MQTSDNGARHLEELALFLSVHWDRGPGILWPDQDHPACRANATEVDLAVLGAELSAVLGAVVRVTRGVPDAPGQVRGGPDSARTLVRQVSRGGGWTLGPGTGSVPAEPFHCRLRAGELLYVPPGRAWTAELSAAARYLLIRVESAG